MKERTRTTNTVKNTYIAFICQIVRMLASFGCRIIFVRCLAMEYLGMDGLFANILTMLSLAELGIGSAINYELYHAVATDNKSEIVSLMQYYKKVYNYIGITVAAIGLVLLPLVDRLVSIDPNIKENVYVLYLLYLLNSVISYFYSYRKSIIYAYQDNYIDSITKEAVVIVQDIIQCVILIVTKQFILYLICQIIFTFVYNYTISTIAKKRYPVICEKEYVEIPKEQKNRMIENVKALVIVRVSNKLVSATDSIIITALCGLSATGVNSNYTIILSVLNDFAFRIEQSVTSSVGNMNAVENDDKKESVFFELLFGYFWIYVLLACGYIFVIQDLVALLFGEQYVMDYAIAVILGVNFFVTQMQVLPETFKTTQGLFIYGKFMALTTGVINIIISVILGRIWGVFGILLATFIAKTITEVWYTPYIIFKRGMHRSPLKYYKNQILMWLEAVMIYFAVYYVCNLFTFAPLLNIIYNGVCCVIVVNVIIWLLHHRSEKYRKLSDRLKRVIFSKLKRA